MAGGIIAIADCASGKVMRSTYETIACARALRETTAGEIKAVAAGAGAARFAEEIARVSGLDAIAIETPACAAYDSEVYKSALQELTRELNPSCVLFAHSTQGMELAPGLAIYLGAACISSIVGMHRHEGGVCFSRAIMNGKTIVKIAPETPAVVLTVQPGAFKGETPGRPAPGKVEVRTFDGKPERIRSLGVKTGELDRSGLTDARAIVAVGRGLKNKDDLILMRRFADMFSRSALAGSRPLIDMEWMERASQVGLTGAAVEPDLYIACGISGSPQHIAGMKGSRFVVAINTDPHAAIFNAADVCVVDDMIPFIETFMRIAKT
jgi:electron transfer flavoprotein alpha subunit